MDLKGVDVAAFKFTGSYLKTVLIIILEDGQHMHIVVEDCATCSI